MEFKSGRPTVAGSPVALQSDFTSTARLITADYVASLLDFDLLADASGTVPPPPTGLTAAPQAAGGTFAARAANLGYFWQVTAVNANGESVPMAAGAAQPIVANGSCVLAWNASPGATSYRVYRTTFADAVYPPIGTPPLLVASGIAGTTYTDTGTATTPTTPPTVWPGAFTITLPDAVQYRGTLRILAIGNTPNVVTVAGAGGQTINGAASIALGQTFAAPYQGVSLISDGTNWRIIASVAAPVVNAVSMGLNSGGVAPNGGPLSLGYYPLAVVPVPVLGFGQRLRVRAAFEVLPAAGATEFIFQLCWCKADGTYQAYNSGVAGTLNGSQLGFGYIQNFTPGEYACFSVTWAYDPRPGDYNAEGAGFGGYAGYMGLMLNVSGGGTSTVFSSAIEIDAGAVGGASYFGSH